jgi:hypothetical protein
MVYPVFTVESISERCKRDIDDFLKLIGSMYDTKLDTPRILNDIPELDITVQNIESMRSLVTTLTSKMSEFGVEKTYVEDISTIPEINQNKLWILRTILFYQLLLFALAIMNNETLYSAIFPQYAFRHDIISELQNFKMGIFGSKNPTSDIDIGIQYAGTNLSTPSLSYIISCIEGLFIYFTGKSCLDFDIEFYADINIITLDGVDYFYVNSNSFTYTEFQKMLPIAGNSILRNIYLAYQDLGYSKEKTKKEIEKMTLDDISSGLDKSIIPVIEQIKGTHGNNWFVESKQEIIGYFDKSYEQQRIEYYKRVDEAEDLKLKLLGTDQTTELSKMVNLTEDQKSNLMVKIGRALTYRMESYTCIPTVIHVVKLLQEGKNELIKYSSRTPISYCSPMQNTNKLKEPFCNIGQYGFILSMLEQIGYMKRFDLTYCTTNVSQQNNKQNNKQSKCDKKIKKYKERYDSALTFLKPLPTYSGGKKKRNTPKSKRIKSKRIKHRKNKIKTIKYRYYK